MIVREGSRLYGRWERPRNVAADRPRSIHDDAYARELGFEGGWVSSRVHLNVFVSVLLEAFGPQWFERGTLSLDFKVATLDAQKVRAVLAATGDPEGLEAHLERPDGTVVAFGTASAGDAAGPTFLGAKDLARYDEVPYGLVDAVVPGDRFDSREITLGAKAAERMVGGVDHPWYDAASPWGPPIASPSLMVNALGAACTGYLRDYPIRGVFVDGGTEIRNVAGPVLLERPYRSGGEVLARGRSPRTEYFWYQGWLDDLDGRRVAEMLLQWRCMPGAA